MRVTLVIIAVALLLLESGGNTKCVYSAVAPGKIVERSASKDHVDFDTQIKLMLQSKCMPCHFSGGQM